MKSYDQLARDAYAVYREEKLNSGDTFTLAKQTPEWDALKTPEKIGWIGAVKKVVEDIRVMHA